METNKRLSMSNILTNIFVKMWSKLFHCCDVKYSMDLHGIVSCQNSICTLCDLEEENKFSFP